MNHFSKERTRLILKSIRTIKITKNLRMTNLFFPLNQKKNAKHLYWTNYHRTKECQLLRSNCKFQIQIQRHIKLFGNFICDFIYLFMFEQIDCSIKRI